MARLEEISKDSTVKGILPDASVTIVDVKWHGSDVVEAVYKGPSGTLGNELLFRDRESTLEIVESGRPWSFTGDGNLLRLVSEAHRIRLAYLFDPVLAVHTSLVDPLPHQITAVYEEMLTRQQFVSIDRENNVHQCGYAPYLDYRAASPDELNLVEPLLNETWLNRDLEQRAISHAISQLVPQHFQEIRNRKEQLVQKTTQAVRDRLTKEITYWDHRAQELKVREEAGRTPRLNSTKAQARADDLDGRLQKRLAELEQERKLSPLPPVAIGGALVIPAGLLRKLRGEAAIEPDRDARETARIEKLAMDAVMQAERDLGHDPRDVSDENRGYDIESIAGQTRRLRFIEVKGRVVGAETVTVTRNEIVTGINSSTSFILAIVQVDGDTPLPPVYVRTPFEREPDFDVTSVNYRLRELLERGGPPT